MKTISAENYIKQHQINNANDKYKSLKPEYELVINIKDDELTENEIIDEELDNEPSR